MTWSGDLPGIAPPKFDQEDHRVRLKNCPSPGTVKLVRAKFVNALERSEALYQVAWDEFPDDDAWYPESALEDAE